ncbi:rhombosortase [Endozoicomonadaceae bacterium StTr2]
MSVSWEHFLLTRTFIDEGQFFMVFSGHFVHLSPIHLGLNMLGTAFVGLINHRFLFSRYSVLAVLFLCLWVSAGILILNPEISRYGGFSGVLHGLFVLAVLLQPAYSKGWKMLLTLAVIAKVFSEQTGLYDVSSLAGSIGGRVAIDAHMYGLVGGLLLYWPLRLTRFGGVTVCKDFVSSNLYK